MSTHVRSSIYLQFILPMKHAVQSYTQPRFLPYRLYVMGVLEQHGDTLIASRSYDYYVNQTR